MTSTELDGHAKFYQDTYTTRYRVGPSLILIQRQSLSGSTLNSQPFTLEMPRQRAGSLEEIATYRTRT